MAAAITVQEKAELSDLYRSLPLPVQSRCVRLLEVRAAVNLDGSDPIAVEFRVANLEEGPPFAALSYVWGKDVEPRSIICGTYTLNVTVNCHSALWHLRKKLGAFTIWVDSVCINQEDKSEKEQQIPLMGDIYTGAETVYLWLGEGNPQSDRAMNFLGRCGFLEYFSPGADSTEVKKKVRSAFWYLITSAFKIRDHPFPTCGPTTILRMLNRVYLRRIPRAVITTYQDIDDVLSREWITRIWTFQEILLASNPILVCGHRHLTWSRFAFSIVFLAYPAHAPDTDLLRHRGGDTSRLPAWIKLVFSRARLTEPKSRPRNTRSPRPETSKLNELRMYQEFLRSVLQKYCNFHYWWEKVQVIWTVIFVVVVFSVLAYIEKTSTISDRSKQAALKGDFIFALAFCIFILSLNLVWRARIRIPHWRRYGRQERPAEDLVDGIISRNSFDPKDKAFGVQSVLQRLAPHSHPEPDYSMPLEQIYKNLSVRLLHATNSLHLLYAAASSDIARRTPSWVPDFSNNNSAIWSAVPLFVVERRNQSIPFWRLDPNNSDLLIVRGYQYASIISCFHFKTTSDKYLDSEAAIHRENLHSMLAVLKARVLSRDAVEILMHMLEEELQQPATVHYTRSDFKLMAWLAVLHRHAGRKTPPDLLSSVKRPHVFVLSIFSYVFFLFLTQVWVRNAKILQTQITICNLLAARKRSFFLYKTDMRGSETNHKHGFGMCNANVHVGDSLVFLSGLGDYFILRGDHGLTQLISPTETLREPIRRASILPRLIQSTVRFIRSWDVLFIMLGWLEDVETPFAMDWKGEEEDVEFMLR
ncbi:HET-domain-containing protein [Mytilinidion resinicola]|uniref:HET-domain-containing protein n=1 Tax=Mytilinidion resinicola TaxID=574789 RepID=A0A6A6YAA6_9PEZI|nr:HET-domain-containing protein [Mytilinidion resinicola]KAF2804757.1 HET-domain-containing protein [Mytilinidion resinicola]